MAVAVLVTASFSMTLLFLFSIGVVLYTYAAYPLIVAALGFIRPCRWRVDDAHAPRLTLIVSAYNEDGVIDEKLHNCLALDYPRDRLEIIVASESSDGTNATVETYAQDGIVLRAFSERRGKSATLFRTVPGALGEIVVFSDANAMYRPDALRKLARNFADPSVGCVIGCLRYRDPSASVGGSGEAIYWQYDYWLRRHATRARGLVPGITGSVFAIRKALYYPFTEERGDDYELCTRIAIRRHAVVFEPEALAEEAASETTRQQFKRKVRLVRWNMLSSLLLIREAIQFRCWPVAAQVFSHRLLRYSVPIWLILALASSAWLAVDQMAYRVAFAAQVGFYALGAAGWIADVSRIRIPRLWLVPSYFVMVNAAAMLAVVAGLSRGQVSLWQKQR